MTSTLGERLRDHWLAQGFAPRPGVRPEDLNAIESRHGVRFPEDFRAYLSVVDGTGRDAGMDANCYCWWSLEELVSVAEQWPEKNSFSDAATCFLFADHLIWAPVYGIRLNEFGTGTEIVVIWSGMEQLDVQPVAPSFSNLMERYLQDKPIH